MAQALANEESNLIEHRDYLKLEEEKRKKTRPVKHGIEGPLLRFISRKEETKVLVKHPPQLQSARFNGLSGSLSSASSEGPVYKPYFASPSPSGSYNSQLQRVLHAARAALPEGITIGLEKSYVIHELGQEEDTPNPTWGETMTVMFGGYNQTSLRETRPPCQSNLRCRWLRAHLYFSARPADLSAYWVTGAIQGSKKWRSVREQMGVQPVDETPSA